MRALDLFCGGGGAAMGLHRAGFEVVGVDIKPQPHFPFTFIQGDALDADLEGFDFIWASPPCQGYSHLTPEINRSAHSRLIPEVRALLIKSGKPYAIENVAGARHELNNPVMLCGSMFGLRTRRHRYFETSWPTHAPCACDHSELPLLVTTASKASRAKRHALGMQPKSVKNAPAAYDIDWMNSDELKEAIPPAYSEFIGCQIISTLRERTLATYEQVVEPEVGDKRVVGVGVAIKEVFRNLGNQ